MNQSAHKITKLPPTLLTIRGINRKSDRCSSRQPLGYPVERSTMMTLRKVLQWTQQLNSRNYFACNLKTTPTIRAFFRFWKYI